MGFFSDLVTSIAIEAVEAAITNNNKTEEQKMYDKKHAELLEYYNYIISETTKNNMYEELFKFLVISMKIGIACATSDGEISTEELKEINSLRDYILSMTNESEKLQVLSVLQQMYENPETIHNLVLEAYSIAEELGLSDISIFTHLIETIIYADGVVDPLELKFYNDWIEKTEIIGSLYNN
jgi:hypothetical protein